MIFNVAGALALFLSVLSISALDVPPNHAPPEMLVIPPNVTIMTPRTGNTAFEKQIFDFRSAQSGFSELRHILQRQGACSTGWEVLWELEMLSIRILVLWRRVLFDQSGWMRQPGLLRTGSTMLQGRDLLRERGVAQSVKPAQILLLVKVVVIRRAQAKVSAAVPTGHQCYRDAVGNANCRGPNPPPPPPPDTKTNVGAIAGGVVAGVTAVVVLVLAFIFWRRRQAKEAPATNVQPPPAPPNTVPPNTSPFNPTGAVPPTSNSGDPFLTPMGQHQNLGVSYFNGAPAPTNPPSGSNSGTGPYNASHYSGLPEPQQSKPGGSTMPMSMPRYDSTHPHPLPMTIVHSQQPQPQTPNARPWSGYTQSSGPYAENNNSQSSGWTPANNGWASPPSQTLAGSASPPYAEQSGADAGRPPSTVNHPPSHLV
ncbi:hypothetical protein FS749_005091 [Ceratobasidium sp. UAMH 11750]|nr:hypothetical protein FS749_005091 [Ceratobasidium sp. UAMH 11750]